MQAHLVSQQAFQQQIANWQMTLHRQSNKLKQLKKISKNRFQINSVEITLIEIQSQLIQYKKIKGKKYQDSVTLIEDYTALSKRFMLIMEKIGEAAEQDRFKDNTASDIPPENTKENINVNKSKHFLQETFTHKVSKEASKKKSRSTITTKKQLSDLLKKEGRISGAQAKHKNSLRISQLPSSLRGLELQQSQDLSDVRYQLKEIKSMMMQIQNEIKFHNHDQMEREMNKLSHNNKRISGEIKSLKQDNQFILARMQSIKDEISHEKTIQAEMIKQFEVGKESKATISELSRTKNVGQEISEWVKVRI